MENSTVVTIATAASPMSRIRYRGNDDAEKVVYVALLVSDKDNAFDFYTNVIGLEKRVTTRHPTDRDS